MLKNNQDRDLILGRFKIIKKEEQTDQLKIYKGLDSQDGKNVIIFRYVIDSAENYEDSSK